ncbi:hypothetical protein [Methanoculleus sp.]|uniref:hypothetical protein n=1 Tax=Methanoculleus sp. TaxID=90427 RepID=UPI0026202A3F|nr:hypothetical protein [Methanoculleus sp.]MDI6866553.1 hypothetical protein [Methanoculleus sp.]
MALSPPRREQPYIDIMELITAEKRAIEVPEQYILLVGEASAELADNPLSLDITHLSFHLLASTRVHFHA